MPLLCKDPHRSPSGQSLCEEHSVEAETHAEEMSKCNMSNVRTAIEGELEIELAIKLLINVS